ncbi:MAG: 16S rRNA (cytosine(967)-C(5))-methyltransferase RsmB [Clostridia bacterium]|nr:16S rRNA (cytosine(967)-C(5))-methyltransferase RsmB [Clostridia bacterium]
MTLRELALGMLDQYELEGKYVNLLLTSHSADSLKREERASLTALLYTVTERKHTYDYYISSVAKRQTAEMDIHTLNILRLGVCQIVAMDSIPDFAAVNETVKLARGKGERAFVNAILRKIAGLKAEGALPMPDKNKNYARYLSVKHSFPLWLTKHFIALVGEENTERIFEHFNTHTSTDITVNTAKVTRDELIATLKADGIDARASELSLITVRINGSVDPRRLRGFDEGHFFVQDTASALDALVLAPETKDRIIDVCACPGGKSFAAAILAGKDAEVSSFDIHESKLSLITSGAKRLGLDNIGVGVMDATKPDTALFSRFDRVICDCPCSGLGVLGKKPDMRYRSEDGIKELPELQYEILNASKNYLKVGGYLVYSTCTLNPMENEDVVRRFLGNHPDFASVEFEIGELKSSGGMLTLWPHIHATDGFFIAKIKRIK